MNTNDNIRSQSHQDPEQLEREINQQRGHISDIVSALENRLSPGEIYDRVMNFGKGGGRDMASNVGSTIKEHPMPAMMAAAGLIWLYASHGKPATRQAYPTDTASRFGSTSAHLTDDDLADRESLGDKAAHLREGAAAKASSARHAVADKASSVKHAVVDKAGAVKETVGHKAHDAMDAVRSGSHRVGSGFSRLLDDNPMAIAAMAIAGGAVLGALLPNTRKEAEWMGERSERLLGQVKSMAHTGLEQTTQTLKDVTSVGSGGSGASGNPGGMHGQSPQQPH